MNKFILADETFDPDHNDLPPPLSLSAPDLRSDIPLPPVLRRSASSTELLYEKAMQKFYQAVQLEEAENERKRSMSIGPNSHSRAQSQDHGFSQMKSYSFDDTGQNLRFKSPITKYSSFDEDRDKVSTEASGSDTFESDWEEEEVDERDLKREILERDNKPIVNLTFEDDYTESTASTASVSAAPSLESIEQFINNVRTSTTNIKKTSDDELETYHPSMEGRALSPYRSPEPGQAAIVLTRPLSMPDPDYVPKPILKRPPSENNENGNENKEPAKSPKPTNKSEKKSFMQLFERKKAPSNDNLKRSQDELDHATASKGKKQPAVDTEREKVALQRRQISIEENRAAVDHYSDLVRELGTKDKPKVPIYMRGEADSEWRDEESADPDQSDASEKVSEIGQEAKANIKNDESVKDAKTVVAKPKSNRPLERNQLVKSESVKNELVKSNPSMERLASPGRGDMVEISVEHKQSITYALREIKQDSFSGDEAGFKAPITAASAIKRETRPSTGAIPKRKPGSASSSRSSSVTRAKVIDEQKTVNIPSATGRQRSVSRTRTTGRSVSKSPSSHARTSLTSTVLKVTRLPLNENYENIAINLSPTMSPSISPSLSPEPGCRTPEQMVEEAEVSVKSSMSYATDVAMFLLACWVYLFKDAKLAIPIIALMVYRQIQIAFKDKLSNWTKRKKS